MRIGRITFDAYGDEDVTDGDGAVLDSTSGNGDNLTITVTVHGTPVTAALLTQWRGLAVNPDEPAIPFITDDRPDLDGFYQVTSTRVGDYDPTAQVATLQAELVRVPGWRSPLGQGILAGAKVDNSHGVPDGGLGEGFWWAVPDGSTFFESFATDAIEARDTDDGGVLALVTTTVLGEGRQLVRYRTPAASWYQGAARISISDVDVVGRQAPWDGTSWAVSNGALKVAGSSTAGRLEVSGWTGAAWSTAKLFKLLDTNDNVIDSIEPVAVLFNSPPVVGVRCLVGFTTSDYGIYTLDIVLRRGARFAECYWVNTLGEASLGKIKRNTSEAGTVVQLNATTCGMRATSTDADGFQYVLFSPRATGGDTLTGGISRTVAAEEWPFGLGLSIPGETYGGPTMLAAQYHHPYGEQLAVVSA